MKKSKTYKYKPSKKNKSKRKNNKLKRTQGGGPKLSNTKKSPKTLYFKDDYKPDDKEIEDDYKPKNDKEIEIIKKKTLDDKKYQMK